jgi:8-oxo-dGTP pyrophosphatase MutT (NUDIX family)
MRAFPHAWVLPGGHVDHGESPDAAALREVEEETGVSVARGSAQALCAWESCFPTRVELGVTKRQHFIVFYSARVAEHANCDQVALRLSETEVCAATWLSPGEVERLSKMPPFRMEWGALPAAGQFSECRYREAHSQDTLRQIAEDLAEGSAFALWVAAGSAQSSLPVH